MKLSPNDINPRVSGTQLPAVDLTRLLATPKIVEPKGPRLNLQPCGAWHLIDMPNELSPEVQGGIVITEAMRKKFDPLVVTTITKVGSSFHGLETGDKVLIERTKARQLIHDNNVYWYIEESGIIAKVL